MTKYLNAAFKDLIQYQINMHHEHKHPKEKSIVIFECVGGSDKGEDGHRKDTLPIIECLKNHGWHAEVVKFQNEKAKEIFDHVSHHFSGYIGRINPGSLPDNEEIYFNVLRDLSKAGLVGMTDPDTMITFGSKAALVQVKEIGLVPEDTYLYESVEDFKKNFPKTLSHSERVLKQNRGSTGQGIWRVVVEDERPYKAGDSLPLDTKIKVTEAFDNHVEHRQLGEFMQFCEQYIVGKNGLLVDMIFLPRIKEGEIRILLVGDKPIFVVHKKPADTADSFSATLFSKAQYRYDSIEKWPQLVDFLLSKIDSVKKILKIKELPLIWTADFILDYNADKSDKYILGEFNCSCVGFTSQLNMGIQEAVAVQAIKQVTRK